MYLKSTKVRILIINDDAAEVKNIESWLGQDMRIPFEVERCASLAEILPKAAGADLIILKPEMEGIPTIEQVYKSVTDAVFEIPIIVLTTGDEAPAFSRFVMEQGAADTVDRGHLSRLVEAVEFGLIRQKLKTTAREVSDRILYDSKERAQVALKASRETHLSDKERHRQILRMFGGEYAFDGTGQ